MNIYDNFILCITEDNVILNTNNYFFKTLVRRVKNKDSTNFNPPFYVVIPIETFVSTLKEVCSENEICQILNQHKTLLEYFL